MAETKAEIPGIVWDAPRPLLGAFLNLGEPRRVSRSDNETPTFSGDFEAVIGADDDMITAIRANIMDAAKQLFPNGVAIDGALMSLGDAIKGGHFLVPFKVGDKLADKAKAKSLESGKERLREWSRGKMVLTARSKDEYPPSIGYVQNGKVIQIEDKDARKAAQGKWFFTGAMVLVGVRFKAYKGVGETGKPGVKAYLEGVVSTGQGEKLIASGKNLADRFSGYVGIDTAETGGAGSDSEW